MHLNLSFAFFLCSKWSIVFCAKFMLENTWNEHKSNIRTFTIVWWKQQLSPPVYGVDPVSSVIIALWFMSNFFWRQISLNCYMKLFWARQIWLNCFTRLICLGPRRVLWTQHNVLSHISIANRNHLFLFTSGLFKRLLYNNSEIRTI